MLSHLRIVLVSPSGPANVGAVCRAMANMGLTDLAIVAPRCDLRSEAAVGFAAHGVAVLEGARVVADIPAALSGCVRTYATTSKLGLYRRQAALTPAAFAEEALREAQRGPVAIAFGREDYGLQNRELLHFDRILTIPADERYPVLNLAAAVTVVCYELRLAALRAAERPALPMAIDHGLATDEQKQILFAKLFDALEGVGFLYGQSPERLKYALRHMFGRLDLSVNEADILIGMARQIRWYVEQHPRRESPGR